MIILHVGKLGVGKSYACTAEIWKWLNEGVDVYANWKIDFSAYLFNKERSIIYRFLNRKKVYGKLYYFDKLSDVYGISNGQIYIDEAHHWLNARTYLLTPADFITKMSQSRHYKTDMHFICQYPGQIETVVRNLANLCIKHTKFWRFLFYKEYDGEVIDQIGKPVVKGVTKAPKSKFGGIRFLTKRFANSYDTHATIGKVFDKFDLPAVWTKKIYEIYRLQAKFKTANYTTAEGVRVVRKSTNGIAITLRSL